MTLTSVSIIIVAVCWLVFILVWIFSAFKAKRTIQNHIWWWGVIIRLALFVLVVWFIKTSGSHGLYAYHAFLVSNPVLCVLGVILCAGGIAFAIWARVYLGRNWGMPMSLKENTELVTNGPYHFVRHPIYSGMLIAMIGTALIVGVAWLIILIASAIYFMYSAIKEEKIMTAQFPNQYPAYKKRTKMLIPFVF